MYTVNIYNFYLSIDYKKSGKTEADPECLGDVALTVKVVLRILLKLSRGALIVYWGGEKKAKQEQQRNLAYLLFCFPLNTELSLSTRSNYIGDRGRPVSSHFNICAYDKISVYTSHTERRAHSQIYLHAKEMPFLISFFLPLP